MRTFWGSGLLCVFLLLLGQGVTLSCGGTTTEVQREVGSEYAGTESVPEQGVEDMQDTTSEQTDAADVSVDEPAESNPEISEQPSLPERIAERASEWMPPEQPSEGSFACTWKRSQTIRDLENRYVKVVRLSRNQILTTGSSTIQIWDRNTFQKGIVFQADKAVGAMDVSPDYIAYGGVGRALMLMRRDGTERVKLQDTQRSVSAVSISRDQRYVAYGTDKGVHVVYEIATRKKVVEYTIPSGGVVNIASMAFGPDGRFLASGSWNKSLYLMNARRFDASKLLAAQGYKSYVTAVAFSADAQELAGGTWSAGTPAKAQIRFLDLAADP
ncbi:MAG: hypothetical protein AAGJ35_05940, partial [Myxococcota bacterium]